jgi:endonuclease V-like protein UPF0215 family
MNKPGIRALGVAESFSPGQKFSVLAGVVMRRDLVIDGVSYGRTSVGGDDATSSIAALFRKFRRNDINLLMVSGAILSLYNVVDVDSLNGRVGVPVVCLTYKETAGIEDSIRRHFPGTAEAKLIAYRKLGPRRRVKLNTGRQVYARVAGTTVPEAKKILDIFTLQGSIPEPVRVARLLARAAQASGRLFRPGTWTKLSR